MVLEWAVFLPALIRPDICGTSLQGKHTIDTVGAILLGKFMAQIKLKHHISLLEHLFFGSVIHCFLTLRNKHTCSKAVELSNNNI